MHLLNSNRIKEEYIGHYMNFWVLCNIDKMENYRTYCARLLKMKKLKLCSRNYGSNQIIEDELERVL